MVDNHTKGDKSHAQYLAGAVDAYATKLAAAANTHDARRDPVTKLGDAKEELRLVGVST
jgi:hypothetical protein